MGCICMAQAEVLAELGGEQDKDDEEEPHGQAQADQAGVVLLHAVGDVGHEIKGGTCTQHVHRACMHAWRTSLPKCKPQPLPLSAHLSTPTAWED